MAVAFYVDGFAGVDDAFGHIGFVVEGWQIFFVVGADVRVFGANINPSDMRADSFYFRDDFEAELVKLAPAAEQERVRTLIVN